MMETQCPIGESELILNADGSIYHLNLKPEDIADTVITVGDPDRVASVSQHFDHIELKKQKREIVTHTGTLRGKRLTVISTGMGTDNIDIVLTELDALVNIDLESRQIKEDKKSLDIIRVGTSGALQADIPVDSFLVSTHGFGFDVLMNFYQRDLSQSEQALQQAAEDFFQPYGMTPYVATGSEELIARFGTDIHRGITATCAGFYGPQGRILRAQPKIQQLIETMSQFHYQQFRLTNFEMETAGIYGLGTLLGHRVCALNGIVVNRVQQTFSSNPEKLTQRLIQFALEKI